MKNICLIILLSSFPSLYSQKLHGRFLDRDLYGKTVYLYDVFQSDGHPIDQSKINSYGKFSFKNTKYDIGFYRISPERQQGILVLLNPHEKEVKMQIDTVGASNRIKIIKSRENMAFHEYFNRILKLYDVLQGLLFEMSLFKIK